jgi:hypothetical protein
VQVPTLAELTDLRVLRESFERTLRAENRAPNTIRLDPLAVNG